MNLKLEAARHALGQVRSGMVLGLGTGSTTAHFIDLVGEHLRSGALKDIVGVPTSEATAARARAMGIPLTTLAENAAVLMDNPSVKIRIEGHCDSRGTEDYNLALGEKRALAARDYLVNFGIAQSRISVISYGEERPLDPAETEKAWAKNRRAEFDIR